MPLPKCLELTTGTDEGLVSAVLLSLMEDPPNAGGITMTKADRCASIDEMSTAKDKFVGKNYLRLSNWASQGASGDWANWQYMVFRSEPNLFFKALFTETKAKANAEFSRTDLFHGHVMWHQTDGLIVVFHAKEYPSDLESSKSSNGKLADTKSASFTKFDKNFTKRNIRYDFRTDSMSIVTTGLQNGFGQQTLDQSYGGKAKALFDINYFPNECNGINDKVFIA
jgi:hypothetical protein